MSDKELEEIISRHMNVSLINGYGFYGSYGYKLIEMLREVETKTREQASKDVADMAALLLPGTLSRNLMVTASKYILEKK